jgi:hypothetical protein
MRELTSGANKQGRILEPITVKSLSGGLNSCLSLGLREVRSCRQS